MRKRKWTILALFCIPLIAVLVIQSLLSYGTVLIGGTMRLLDSYAVGIMEQTVENRKITLENNMVQHWMEVSENEEKISKAAEKFQTAIKLSLRRGDLYTRYSSCQFLVMLPGITQENCFRVAERISRLFKDAGGGSNRIKCYVSSLIDVNEEPGDFAHGFSSPGNWFK